MTSDMNSIADIQIFVADIKNAAVDIKQSKDSKHEWQKS